MCLKNRLQTDLADGVNGVLRAVLAICATHVGFCTHSPLLLLLVTNTAG